MDIRRTHIEEDGTTTINNPLDPKLLLYYQEIEALLRVPNIRKVTLSFDDDGRSEYTKS